MAIQGSQFQVSAAFGSAVVTVGAAAQGSTFAKVDTRLLVDTAASATNDESQRATALTSTAGGAYETASARLAIDEPRCIEVRFSANNTDAGTILAHTDTVAAGAYRLRLDGAGVAELYADVGVMLNILDVPLPSVSASTETFVMQWSTIQDPDQDAGGDAARWLHEVTIYNEDQDAWTIVQHEEPNHAASDPADAFAYGGYWNGATLSDAFGGAIGKIRIGVRFHSSSEMREDWIAQSATAVSEVEVRDPLLSIGTTRPDGEFAGPEYAHAGAMVRQTGQRSLSPLVNLLTNSPPTLQNTFAPASRWAVISFDGVEYNAPISLLWHRPVPKMANRLRVSVHLQVWDGAEAGTPRTVNVIAASSSARPGTLQILGGTPIETYWITGTRTADDLSGGMGDYVTMSADLRIARDDDDFTWLYLAFQIPPLSGSDALWKVHAVSFDTVAYPTSESFPLEVGP